jgi:toxin CcdB
VVPLVLSSDMALGQTRITPRVSIEGAEYYIFTPTLTCLDVRKIQRADFVCNMSDYRGDILAAMDALITNT